MSISLTKLSRLDLNGGLNFTSWNQIAKWLSRLDLLRRAALTGGYRPFRIEGSNSSVVRSSL